MASSRRKAARAARFAADKSTPAPAKAASRKTVPSGEAVVSIQNVEFTWPGRQAFSIAIDKFTLQRGEKLLLIGPSGSGKSTFLSLLAGIITPARGSITALDREITQLSSSARDRFRAEHFGIVFQMFNLLPYGAVIDNVVLPLSFAPKRRARAETETGIEEEAHRLLTELGLDDTQINGPASALSVGQQQRVAAARALIGHPEIIIADEPTSALDKVRQEKFLDLLFAQLETAGTSLIMVSHDESLGPHFDRVRRLDEIVITEAAK